MADKHPSWFKMKIEHRELIRQLSPETAVNVLLACWEFLETGEKPTSLSPIENVAFASFMPDMDEAWKRYLQRISARNQSVDIDRYQTISSETEEETETETEPETDSIDRKSGANKPPKRSRFVPPDVSEVVAYCSERKNGIDPAAFIDYYTTRGWRLNGGQTMKDWKAAVRTWERRDKSSQGEQPPSVPKMTYHVEIVDGEEVDVPDGP